MSIEEQLEIVESNIAEYGVCDITIEEYRHLKQQIREDAIEEIRKKVELVEEWLFDCCSDNNWKCSIQEINVAFRVIKKFLKKLKEQKNDKE